MLEKHPLPNPPPAYRWREKMRDNRKARRHAGLADTAQPPALRDALHAQQLATPHYSPLSSELGQSAILLHTQMSEPLDYLRKPNEPAARWSLCAVIGFALSLAGPLLGRMLGLIVEPALQFKHDTLLMSIAVSPMAVGLALSIIGAVTTSSRARRIRGRRLAFAGILIPFVWIAAVSILIYWVKSHMET